MLVEQSIWQYNKHKVFKAWLRDVLAVQRGGWGECSRGGEKSYSGDTAEQTAIGKEIEMAVGRHRSGLLTAGGVLTIIAGVLAVGMGIAGIVLFAGVEWGWWGSQWGVDVQNWFDVHGVRGVLSSSIVSVFLGGIAIIGGISALAVRSWGLALIGAICGLLTSFLLGLLGLIFIAIRKKDFA